MDIDSTEQNRDSVQEFADGVLTFVDAGAGIIHVRTSEVSRASKEIRRTAVGDGYEVAEWDPANGTCSYNEHTCDHRLESPDGNVDFNGAFRGALEHVLNVRTRDIKKCFVYVNPQLFMDSNPSVDHLLAMYTDILPSSNAVVIIVTPDIPLPTQHDSILSLRFNTPGLKELRSSLSRICDQVREDFSEGVSLTEADEKRICFVGAGMTKVQFETWVSLSAVNAGREGKDCLEVEDIVKGVSEGKTEVVNSSDILELYPSTSLSNVGGLENLKKWIALRSNCYSDAAKKFGVEAPKGIVLVGVPGTGKSLVAKAVASELGVPLVRLDFGRVFNSLVGASESRMRQALHQVEAMAPVVLFCVSGSTEVTTSEGVTRRIEDLYADLQAGHKPLMLRGMDPATGALVDLPLRTIIRTQGKPMVRVTSESGKSIEVTTDHRLLVNRNGGRVWVQAGGLKEGDDLVEV